MASESSCAPDTKKIRLGEDLQFAHISIGASSVLLRSPSLLTVALLGVQPIAPFHVVVTPSRQVERFAELTPEEVEDFWKTALEAQQITEKHHKATAFNLALLDGATAGQPVPQLHAHVVPRTHGDALGEDKIHDAIACWTPIPGGPPRQAGWDGPADENRRPRTAEEMAAEASRYRVASDTAGSGAIGDEPIKFAKFDIGAMSIFYKSPSGKTLAFVNLKPLVPGHVLVIPVRVVPRLADLSAEEVEDLFQAVRRVQAIVCAEYGSDSANIGIQDGKDSGQSVPHVHVHILPRKAAEAGEV